MKHCKKCETDKQVSEFHTNRNAKDGLQAYCKSCMNASTKDYYQTEQGKLKIKNGVKKKAESGYYRYGKGAITILEQGAKKRNLPFRLTEDELTNWWKKTPDKCYYCSIDLNDYIKLRDAIINYYDNDFDIVKYKTFFKSSKHKAIKCMTIDRLQNENGYELNNIVKSCWICNKLKGDFFTAQQIKQMTPEFIKKLIEKLNLPSISLKNRDEITSDSR